ncbi:putative ribonuclease H-like domain-containing protein [Tanacetum coccineum]
MNYIPVSIENQLNVDAGTQEHYVAGSSEKDKEPTQEYILLLLHPPRQRISIEDVVQAAQEKPSKNSPKDSDVQDSEDVAKTEEQHTLTEAEQVSKDDIERMIAQEIAAKAIDDATRQAFEEKKGRAAQATSINKLNIGRPSVSTSNSPLVSTTNTPYASAPSTPTEDDSNVFPNDGIFSRAYDDEDVGAKAAFNNMDNTDDVSPIPTLRVHKDHPKGGRYRLDDVFAPVARFEVIRGGICSSTPGFVDLAHPKKFIRLIKALLWSNQAPRAWYETLSSFHAGNGFRRATIDKTLFIKKNKSDIMLVQVYVDDIIFGSTTQSMCIEFEDCMLKRF